jgi:hypothetical protein
MTKTTSKQQSAALPVYVRPPARGQEYFSGFSRSKLYKLERCGKIKGRSLKEPGKRWGVKLYHLGSILDYIEGQA